MNPSLARVLERSDIRRGDAFAVAPAPTLASGFPALDAELPGGGWPRGALTELLTEHEGIGELGLLLPALAALTAAGQTVVLIAPPRAAHAPAWAAAGIRLDGLRLVFPRRPR
ncbi:MAG: SOS cell division inhibitor SulA, partial [Sulfuritalea sp.]|nr:SOS cell division inhibitor SulA [Sulfuritalea sp.]